MHDLPIPVRERQALAEVGRTSVSGLVAWMATLVFLLTVFGIPLVEPLVRRVEERMGTAAPEAVATQVETVGRFLGSFRASFTAVRTAGPLQANRSLLAAMDELEQQLEDSSFLRRWLLPPLQWRMAAWGGVGNEQVYIGRDGWLFFKADFDHVTGQPFLEPRVLSARQRGGEAWVEAPEPDPVPAIVDLRRQLEEMGIELLVVPTPVKIALEPERFTTRATVAAPAVQNASFASFIERLQQAGVEVVDVAGWLAEATVVVDGDRYLRTDTHWAPQLVDEVARALARLAESTVELAAPRPGLYRRRRVAVVGNGDLEEMLWLPEGQRWLEPQRVDVQLVSDRAGRRWQPRQESEILLLGDSFTNVYSEATLGWGTGAGLAEQLSFHLQRPVDRLAVNAGGALGGRRALQRSVSEDRDRLAGTKLVIYQFASRELSQGDWRRLEIRDANVAPR